MRKENFGIIVLAIFVFVEVFTRMIDSSFVPTRFIKTNINSAFQSFADYGTQSEPLHLSKTEFRVGNLHRTGAGTGFFVTNDGVIVTNHHVIRNCEKIEIVNRDQAAAASVLFVSKTYDLAALKVAVAKPSKSKRFVLARPKLASAAFVFGYPLEGYVSDSGNYGEGVVSAEGGIRQHPELFQVTAPIQLGHSGSAVVDQSGNLIGVATAKLDVVSVALVTGDIAQNVNFAISSKFLGDFLSLAGVNLKHAAELNFFEKYSKKLLAPSPRDALIHSAVKINCYGPR